MHHHESFSHKPADPDLLKVVKIAGYNSEQVDEIAIQLQNALELLMQPKMESDDYVVELIRISSEKLRQLLVRQTLINQGINEEEYQADPNLRRVFSDDDYPSDEFCAQYGWQMTSVYLLKRAVFSELNF